MEPFVRHGDSMNASKISFEIQDQDGEEDEEDDSKQMVFTIKQGHPQSSHNKYTTEIVNVSAGAETGHQDDEDEDGSEEIQGIAHAPSSTVKMDEAPQEKAGPSGTSSSANTDQLLTDLAHPDLAFFRSLLPDMENMTPAQKAKFKCAVMGALTNIMYPS